MVFSKKCYIGETVRKKNKIIKRLTSNYPYQDIYCICIGNHPHHLMDILKSTEIIKDFYSHKQYKIIGIANGKNEAFELTRKIIESVYKEYKDPQKIKEFFSLE